MNSTRLRNPRRENRRNKPSNQMHPSKYVYISDTWKTFCSPLLFQFKYRIAPAVCSFYSPNNKNHFKNKKIPARRFFVFKFIRSCQDVTTLILYDDAVPVKNLITGHTLRAVICGNPNIIASFYHNHFQTISVLSCFWDQFWAFRILNEKVAIWRKLFSSTCRKQKRRFFHKGI